MKISRFRPIDTRNELQKFKDHIESQPKVRDWEPKNPVWLSGDLFENDIIQYQ